MGPARLPAAGPAAARDRHDRDRAVRGRHPATTTNCWRCRGSAPTPPPPSPSSRSAAGTRSSTRTSAACWQARSGREFPGAQPSAAEYRLAESLLPADEAIAARWSVAVMELGALTCTAASPRCGDCPVAAQCAWLAAGRPAAEIRPVGQRYEGTDRQCRGRLLAVLRDSPEPVAQARLDASGPMTSSAPARWTAWWPTAWSTRCPTAASPCRLTPWPPAGRAAARQGRRGCGAEVPSCILSACGWMGTSGEEAAGTGRSPGLLAAAVPHPLRRGHRAWRVRLAVPWAHQPPARDVAATARPWRRSPSSRRCPRPPTAARGPSRASPPRRHPVRRGPKRGEGHEAEGQHRPSSEPRPSASRSAAAACAPADIVLSLFTSQSATPGRAAQVQRLRGVDLGCHVHAPYGAARSRWS